MAARVWMSVTGETAGVGARRRCMHKGLFAQPIVARRRQAVLAGSEQKIFLLLRGAERGRQRRREERHDQRGLESNSHALGPCLASVQSI